MLLAPVQLGIASGIAHSPLIAKTLVAKSLVAEPIVVESVLVSEPVASEPVILEPAISDLSFVEPTFSEYTFVKSVVSEPTFSEPTFSRPVTAQPAVEDMNSEPIQLAQVTSVSALSDVQPGDWAFAALQRLVEAYGCLEGYPEQSFRGDRALTRYEFAAGLNACLDVVTQLIGEPTQLDEIHRLQTEFATELATLQGRIAPLEADVASLEARQFSTTTKLRGQLDAHFVVPFGEADDFDDDPSQQGDPQGVIDENSASGLGEADATFEYRLRLNLDTSFTGEDRLRIRLQASDDAGALANSEGGLVNQSSRRNDLEDNVAISDIYYNFPLNSRISATVAANSVAVEDFVTSIIDPFDGNVGGPEFYSLYDGGESLGIGANIAFSDNVVLDLGYSTDSGNINDDEGGLLVDSAGYVAQLNFLTDDILDAAIVYIGTHNQAPGDAKYTIAGLVNFDFGRFQIGGHYASSAVNEGGNLNSYGGSMVVSGLLGKANEFGLYAGISPALNRDPLLLEAYYQITVNDVFTLTPSVVYTDNDSGIGKETNMYGVLRATVTF